MDQKEELLNSEVKTYSFENFGQILKVSDSVGPEVFPFRVTMSANSLFFRDMRDRLLRGVGGTWGNVIERSGLVGVNDLGTLMISNQIFDGNFFKSLTNKTKTPFFTHLRKLKNIPMPPGWRTFGTAHSHPFVDVLNHVERYLQGGIPSVGFVPVTWSAGDFQYLMNVCKDGSRGITCETMISPTQINFMVATKETIEKAKYPDKELRDALKMHPSNNNPPYPMFEKLGLVLYSGNHFGKTSGEILLERLK